MLYQTVRICGLHPKQPGFNSWSGNFFFWKWWYPYSIEMQSCLPEKNLNSIFKLRKFSGLMGTKDKSFLELPDVLAIKICSTPGLEKKFLVTKTSQQKKEFNTTVTKQLYNSTSLRADTITLDNLPALSQMELAVMISGFQTQNPGSNAGLGFFLLQW